jgi:hypothetical protein
MRASDSVEQLQRFATQLSIRLIWMERAHPGVFGTAADSMPTELAAPPALAEVTHAPPPAPNLHPILLHWRPVTIAVAWTLAGLLGLILAFRVVRRWHRRRVRNSVWILPEVEVKPRFGAPHCGQGGVWIRFG